MDRSILLIGCIIFICHAYSWAQPDRPLDTILREENEQLRLQRNELTMVHWNLEANLTDHNEEMFIRQSKSFDEFRKNQSSRAAAHLAEWAGKADHRQLRQLEKLRFLGFSVLDGEDASEFRNVQIRMEKIHTTAKIDVAERKNLTLEPDLANIMETSLDEKMLKEIWIKYRDATGRKMRLDFIKYCQLGNKAAQSLDEKYKTIDDVWMFDWESDDIKRQVEKLMENLNRMYRKIHAYVRYHLRKVYGDVMPADGTIPAHLLGNMWGQTWSHLLTLIPEMRFRPQARSLDEQVNPKLQRWTVRRMFELSEQFFHSIGMANMTETFWQKSILTKVDGVEMVCHASAWDFFTGQDFRIKQCTQNTLEDLVVIHHEMGHIQYYMQYAQQEPVFREGANPGFHEAIGDLISLSVLTPEHLRKVGLLAPDNDKDDPTRQESYSLNYQLRMALDKIVFLPFAFVMDKWRWDVFRDEDIRESQMNRHWWRLRLQHQGISPPVRRSEEDFDPGSKYHIPAGVEYVRYFVSHILQFQFYRRLCQLTNHSQELYKCDFYENQMAGQALMKMMQKGSAEHWQTILNQFMDDDQGMSLVALYEYFQPLDRYLDEFIQQNQIQTGWKANVDDYFEGPNPSSSLTSTLSMVIALLSVFICFLLFQSGMLLVE